VIFVVDEVGLEQIFFDLFGFPQLNIIPLLLHTHLSLPPEAYDEPEQAAHYNILWLFNWGA
jgi:hypothetical protein